MIEKFLISLLTAILKMLAQGAIKEAQQHAAKIDLEKERGETDAANVAKYEAANDRAERITAALDLLNRVPPRKL